MTFILKVHLNTAIGAILCRVGCSVATPCGRTLKVTHISKHGVIRNYITVIAVTVIMNKDAGILILSILSSKLILNTESNISLKTSD